MPRVRSPSQADILRFPREYALLQQAANGLKDGEVDSKELSSMLQTYGDGKAPQLPEDLAFEEFAKLFARPSSKAESGSGNTIGYVVQNKDDSLKPWRFDRRALRDDDVRIQITHAGICHSDIHQVRNEWANGKYPMVPGHEIAGIVTEVGSKVTKFKVGDRVGVGCMVDSCQGCRNCLEVGEEQYCEKGAINTYNDVDRYTDNSITFGGYSTQILVREKFVLHVPTSLPLKHVAPLLCAGITVYSPIRKFGFDKPGLHIGVVGLGGLGHMAVKFLKAFGAHVTIISTSPSKKEEALKGLGADAFLVSKDEEAMKAAARSLDGILDCVSAQHDLGALLNLAKLDATLVCVGVPPSPPPMPMGQLIFNRQRVAGSLIGGIRETQEMLDFCADKHIYCSSEIVPIDYVNTAYDRVVRADVRYRFVIDIQGSLIN